MIPPRPGSKARYYCIHCNKRFSATVPGNRLLNLFGPKTVKCPDCKKPCGFDPAIHY